MSCSPGPGSSRFDDPSIRHHRIDEMIADRRHAGTLLGGIFTMRRKAVSTILTIYESARLGGVPMAPE